MVKLYHFYLSGVGRCPLHDCLPAIWMYILKPLTNVLYLLIIGCLYGNTQLLCMLAVV